VRFDLTRPCGDCPFRRMGGIRIRAGRIREIAGLMLEEGAGGSFTCHNTRERRKVDRQHCAGALIFALKNGVETQVMQLAHRLGLYDPKALRGRKAIFDTVEEFLSAAD
jgi:hypothetical protein